MERTAQPIVGYLDQKQAATYLGVKPKYFRAHVHVAPFVLPSSGSRPLLRYRIADLDAWMDKLKDPKSRAA